MPLVSRPSEQVGPGHSLASEHLYTDGAEILDDYAEREGDTPAANSARQLLVVRKEQDVFNEVVPHTCTAERSGPMAT